MADAYRENAGVARVPLARITWRRTVGRGAELLVAFLLIGAFATPLADAFLALALPPGARSAFMACFDLLAQAGVAVATWKLTAPSPAARVGKLGWALRASVALLAAFTPLARLGVTPAPVAGLISACVNGAGLFVVARLFDDLGAPRHAKRSRALAVPLALAPSIMWLAGDKLVALLAVVIGVAALLAFTLLWRLRRLSRVVDHQWWFDDGGTGVAWASELELGDGRVEVLSADARLGYFASRNEAAGWLEAQAFVPAAAAVERHLVAAAPAPVLVTGPRKKQRRHPRR